MATSVPLQLSDHHYDSGAALFFKCFVDRASQNMSVMKPT
jgi:hypothetical protein